MNSRRKGAAAEREVAAILTAHGYTARRDGRLDTDLDHDIPGVHLEIKRCERWDLPRWIRQAERDCGGLEPVVVFRSSRQPWRVVVGLDYFLRGVPYEPAP